MASNSTQVRPEHTHFLRHFAQHFLASDGLSEAISSIDADYEESLPSETVNLVYSLAQGYVTDEDYSLSHCFTYYDEFDELGKLDLIVVVYNYEYRITLQHDPFLGNFNLEGLYLGDNHDGYRSEIARIVGDTNEWKGGLEDHGP
jgi:hypothetical protein